MLPLRFAKSASWYLLLTGCLLVNGPAAMAAESTAKEIDAKVDAALDRLHKEVPGSDIVVKEAKGILVFAGVIKAGFVIAGEGGEGALRIGGKTDGYYSIFAGSVGFQAGGQKRDIIMAFLDAGALKHFQEQRRLEGRRGRHRDADQRRGQREHRFGHPEEADRRLRRRPVRA